MQIIKTKNIWNLIVGMMILNWGSDFFLFVYLYFCLFYISSDLCKHQRNYGNKTLSERLVFASQHGNCLAFNINNYVLIININNSNNIRSTNNLLLSLKGYFTKRLQTLFTPNCIKTFFRRIHLCLCLTWQVPLLQEHRNPAMQVLEQSCSVEHSASGVIKFFRIL